MSKRDDLDKEAKGEIGVFGMIASCLGVVAAYAVHRSIESIEDGKVRDQIDSNNEEKNSIDRELSAEKGKPFLIRDNSKISSLEQRIDQLIAENEELKKKL